MVLDRNKAFPTPAEGKMAVALTGPTASGRRRAAFLGLILNRHAFFRGVGEQESRTGAPISWLVKVISFSLP